MKKIRRLIRRGTRALAAAMGLLMLLGGGRVGATDYGTWRTDRLGLDNALTYSTTPLILGDGDEVIGFAILAGGFHTADADNSVTFSNVIAPIADDIYLRGGAHINFEGDLTLSTTSIEAAGSFMINASGNTLFLEKDTTLPGQTIQLTTGLVVDGQGHTLTFDASTMFAMDSALTLTLKNMVVKGLQSGIQFNGNTRLALQNCILDISGNDGATAFTYGWYGADNASRLYIHDDVVVQGGGTFAFGGNGNGSLTIQPYSTLYFDLDTTFSYWSPARTKVRMSDTSTIHINGGTLKARGAQGLQLHTGRLLLENKCTLDNGTNADMANGIQLGDGNTDLTVKVLAGARVEINGSVWYNSDGAST